MSGQLHPVFEQLLSPFAPQPARLRATHCAECGQPVPARFHAGTDWGASGVCSPRCWEDFHMEGQRHERPEGDDK